MNKMTTQPQLEEVARESFTGGVDLTNLDIEAVESGVLKDMLKSGYAPTEEGYSSSWSRTSYTRKVRPCRLIWP